MELNLNTRAHKPFTKQNNTIQYINVQNNHSQSHKKNIPLACQKRLSLLSSNEDIFNSVVPQYQDALDKAGHTHQLKYDPTAVTGTIGKRYRSKHVHWFNPPFSEKVKTNVGAEFLKIVSSSFTKGHSLHQIFNINTIKVSYRTTANMGQVISRHNKQVSNKIKETTPTRPYCTARMPTSPVSWVVNVSQETLFIKEQLPGKTLKTQTSTLDSASQAGSYAMGTTRKAFK